MPFPLFVFASSVIAVATVTATVFLSRRPQLAVLAALAGATGLLLFHGPAYFDYYADDAYITLRYSRHLVDGLGPNWNATGHVEGYTSFSWMGIHAGLGKLGVDLVGASQVLGFLAVLATFLVLYRIWQLWSDDEPRSGIEHPLVLAAALLALALSDAVPFWGFSGMETPLFMALITTSAYLYLQEQRTGGFPWSALAVTATAMTRPEGLIVAAVTGTFVVADAWRAPDRQRALRRVLLWGALFAVPYGIYFGWRWSYYGYPFPNTFYAKVGATSAVFNRGLEYISTYGLRYQLLLMVVGAAFIVTRPRLRNDAAYVLALAAAMLLGIVFEGGEDFPNGRFIAPILPLLYLGGLAGFAVALKQLALDPLRTAVVVAATLSLGGLSLLPSSFNPALARERDAHDERQLIGAWLSENTPSDYTIAAYAVGAIGYYADDRPILDMLGLNDEVIAHTYVPHLGEGIAGHEKYNIDYVLEEVRPEIIVPSDAEPGALTEDELRVQFSRPSPVPARDKLLTDPRLWERYDVRSLQLEGRWFNILVRTDSLGELRASGLR